MSLKKFEGKDLVYSTLVANPKYSLLVHNSLVYKNDEILDDGNFSNKIKHIANGQISLHELNINRPADSLIYGYIEKQTSRYAHRTISTSDFDSGNQFNYGDKFIINYPLKSGLSRIFVPAGIEIDDHTPANMDNPSFAHENKKYIRALRNVINSREALGQKFHYDNLGTTNVNIICIPAIFYGSTVQPKTIELNYYINGTLTAQAKDNNGDGVLIETVGTSVGAVVGCVIYEQGLVVLTADWSLSATHTDNFFSTNSTTSPNWLSFGTGLPENSSATDHGPVINSIYEIKFSGTNKIPTLTMLAFSPRGTENFSNNPSFLDLDRGALHIGDFGFQGSKDKIKNIAHSTVPNYNAPFKNVTFISKVGIYDEEKRLIAIATLANPAKKTTDREFMFKMRLDF